MGAAQHPLISELRVHCDGNDAPVVVVYAPWASAAGEATLRDTPGSLLHLHRDGQTEPVTLYTRAVESVDAGSRAPGLLWAPSDPATEGLLAGSPLRLPERKPLHLEVVADGATDVSLTAGRTGIEGEWTSPLGRQGTATGWRFSPGHLVGQVTLQLSWRQGDAAYELGLTLLILPDKLESLTLVEQLYRDVASAHVALLLQQRSAADISLSEQGPGKRPPLQQLMLIEHFWSTASPTLESAVRAILRRPHQRALTTRPMVPTGRARSVDAPRLARSVARPGGAIVVDAGKGHVVASTDAGPRDVLFTRVPDRRVTVTRDTPPNRFLAAALRVLEGELRRIQAALQQAADSRASRPGGGSFLHSRAQDARELAAEVATLRRSELFDEVQVGTTIDLGNAVLQNDPRYRIVVRAYVALFQGMRLPDAAEALLEAPLAELPELYEYWCLLQLIEVLRRQGWAPDGVAFARHVGRDGHTLESNSLKVGFTTPDGGQAVLYYDYSARTSTQPLHSYSVSLRPDFTLEVRDTEGCRFYVFDAKYRVDLGGWTLFENEDAADRDVERQERRGRFQRGDLYKMHTYREALRPRPEWVIVLYPGDTFRFFQGEDGGVGVVPLRPQVHDAGDRELLEVTRG